MDHQPQKNKRFFTLAWITATEISLSFIFGSKGNNYFATKSNNSDNITREVASKL